MDLKLAVVIVLILVVILLISGQKATAFVVTATVATVAATTVIATVVAAAAATKTGGSQDETSGEATTKSPFTMDDFEQAPETKYSSPRDDHILQEICYFRKEFPAAKNVIDATAHVGVDTAVLAHSFPEARITAVERDPKTYKLLERNMEKMGLSNRVTVLNDSSADYLRNLNSTRGDSQDVDLVYIDPPWGGPQYRFRRSIDDLPLYDESGKPTISLAEVVADALKVSPAVVLKVPFNFDFRAFERRLEEGRVVNVARIQHHLGKGRPVFLLLDIRKEPCRET